MRMWVEFEKAKKEIRERGGEREEGDKELGLGGGGWIRKMTICSFFS